MADKVNVLFISRRSNFSIAKPPGRIPVERNGRLVYVEEGGKSIEFKSGRYRCTDQAELDYLTDHPSYGVDFFKVGDTGTPTEVLHARVPSAKPKPGASEQMKTQPLTSDELESNANAETPGTGSELTAIEDEISNKNQAVEALQERGVDVTSYGITPNSNVDEIKQAAKEAGYTFANY